MNELVKYEYQGQEINFTGDGWFNATEVATKFGRIASEWIRLPSTTEYISALERRYGKIPYVKTSKARKSVLEQFVIDIRYENKLLKAA